MGREQSFNENNKKPELSGFLLVLYVVGASDLWGRTSRLWGVPHN